MNGHRHLAIVLPGQSYGPLGPAIRIPLLAVEQVGAEVVEVRYPERPATEDEPWDAFHDSVLEQVRAAVADARPDEITFVAKSLGTVALAALPPSLLAQVPVRAIWLTPIFGQASVRAGAIAMGRPSLLVAGGGDDLHAPQDHAAVAGALRAESLVIPRADHLLEVPGDVIATADGFRSLAERALGFLRR
ncbi:hypothetical protein GHK86_11615 [Acidimicrobiaceae bacterium USS-CC1]|uniref:Alpha/beta hydrolase n=1 Tax=Acidiferrimicrobium australe TaxID=2664430 RepID=A0ABW9QU22_9ACTN|nr:hypothetical protein [Acidiferrimicrobium australe]